ncbi:MAG: hypothetical protein Q9175_008093, partial [Cornicularia normoerica]
ARLRVSSRRPNDYVNQSSTWDHCRIRHLDLERTANWPRNSHIKRILSLNASNAAPSQQRKPLKRIRLIDTIIDDPSRNPRDIRKSEYSRIAIILAGDYDSATRFGAHLPAGWDLSSHCSRVSAKAKALCEVWRSDQDCEGIVAGFEVGGLDTGGLLACWGVAVGYNGIET